MDKILIEWLRECTLINLPIHGVLLKEKAIMVKNRIRIENFKGSNGWLERFIFFNLLQSNTFTARGDKGHGDKRGREKIK